MEWQSIPQPLNIRPCERPSDLKARQLAQYPANLKYFVVNMRKLPPWVDKAYFQVNEQTQSADLSFVDKSTDQEFDNNYEKQFFSSLSQKYEKNRGFKRIFARHADYSFNPSFAYEFIPSDYIELEECKSKAGGDDHEASKRNRTDLEFDSNFECGNLLSAYKKCEFESETQEYHLLMQNDINTRGYNQWFCFSISNPSESKTICIRIVNFVKSKSLYQNGMRPWAIHSSDPIWRPFQQSHCQYSKTNVKSCFGQTLSELKFYATIKRGLTFFSMMPIYSYSRLCTKIQKWKGIKGMSLTNKPIHSLLNNVLPVLEFVPQEDGLKREETKWIDTIVVSARTHPGEVWSSFLMEELIDNIVLYHKTNLSSKIRYILIPMLNPDGVIYGNFRCDFSGVDLNRAWSSPHKYLQPNIYHLKKLLAKEFEMKKAKYYIDLHSHSKNYNVFAYSCAQSMTEARLVPDLVRLSNENKIFDPYHKSQEINLNFLTSSQCTFISSKNILNSRKSTTARAFMSQYTEKGNAVTIEISFHGYQQRENPHCIENFELQDFKEFSWLYLRKLNDYLKRTEEVALARRMLKSIYHNQERVLLEKIKSFKTYSGEFEDINQDSESEPQKYYAPQTVKKLKITEKQSRATLPKPFSGEKKKGYMKKTQSMIQRFEDLKKETQIRKRNLKQKQEKLDKVVTSIRNRSIPTTKGNFSDNAKNEKQHSSHSIGEHIQIHKKHKGRFVCKIDNSKLISSKYLENFSEPRKQVEAIDMTKQISNKIEPTFGKFLPSGKRHFATRRYNKALPKQQKVTARLQADYLNSKMDSSYSERMYLNTEISNKTLQKYCISGIESPGKVIESPNKDNRLQSRQSMSRNRSKRSERKVNNQNEGYVKERRKIFQMMKRETRLSTEGRKSQIQEIVNRRTRSKTQYEPMCLELNAYCKGEKKGVFSIAGQSEDSNDNSEYCIQKSVIQIINGKFGL